MARDRDYDDGSSSLAAPTWTLENVKPLSEYTDQTWRDDSTTYSEDAATFWVRDLFQAGYQPMPTVWNTDKFGSALEQMRAWNPGGTVVNDPVHGELYKLDFAGGFNDISPEGSFLEENGWLIPLGIATAGLAFGGLAGAGAAGAAGAADAAGLSAMAADAGLAGTAADAFVASGGTLGSTAAGGGGVTALATEPVMNGWNIFDAPQQFANTTTTTAGPQTMVDVPGFEGPPPQGAGEQFFTPNPLVQEMSAIPGGVSTAGTFPAAEHALANGLSTGAAGTGAFASMAPDILGGTSLWPGGGATGVGAPGGGLVDGLIDWAKNNQMLASTGLNLAGGFIKGAMAPTLEEQAKAAADARIAVDNSNRAATRIPPARWPKPTGRVLRTPGQLPPGLINRAMGA